MAAYRQSKSVGTAGSATTVVSPALTSAVLAGSRLVAYIVWGATTGSIGTVSDSVNGTTGWVKVTNSNASEATGPTQGEFWTNPNSAAGSSLVVTATFAAGASFGFTAIAVHEVTGTDPTEGAAATASARSQSSVTNFTTANITPSVAGCYIMGGCSNDVDSVVPTANSPYTLRETTANQVTATEDQVQGAAAAVGASFTFAAAKSGVVNVVAFKPAPSGGQAPLMLPLMQMAPNGPIGPMALAMRLFRTPSPDAVTAVNIAPGFGVLTLTGFAPTLGVGLTPGTGALTLNGFGPTLGLGLTPGTGQLTMTGFAPVLGTGVTPGTGVLTLTGFAPRLGLGLTPGTASLTLSGLAPTLGLGITPGVGALTLTGFAPSVLVGVRIVPSTGALNLTGFAPTLAITQNVTLTTGTGILTLTGFPPTVVSTVTAVVLPPEPKRFLIHRGDMRFIRRRS